MVSNYGRVTLRNITALTEDVRYGCDSETNFTNPQTSQNGLSTTRKISENQTFRKAVIQVLSTATCDYVEFSINSDRDNLIIVGKGGARTLDLSDRVFIQGIDVIPRGANAAIGDIIVELS